MSLTKDFLSVHWDREKPLLLAYSGGPDSKALLYALLEVGAHLSIAHVDHGWREESLEEAKAIEEEAKQLGCSFFSIRLQPKEKSEDEARKARYAFFEKIFPGHAALLLAHTADDLAETVLKRVLEGAHLTHLGGMRAESWQLGMPIWRPFLSIYRSAIFPFLEERNLKPLLDASNSDPSYLRARMRADLFPLLNECFGKETRGNLTLLSERAHELSEYFEKKLAHHPIQKGPWGFLCDLSGLERLERTFLLQKMAKGRSLILNRDHLNTLLTWIEQRETSKCLILKTNKIFVDKGIVWFV